jgi:hypothetical protein
MNSNLEKTLLLALMASHLDSGGDIRVKEHLWTGTYRPDTEERLGFACLKNDEVEGSWNDGDGASDHVLLVCKNSNVKWDDIIFYPKDDDRTGVPWRMLKLDMPFLRIVLLKDETALFSITRRLASIMDKALAEGLGVQQPKPGMN